MATGASQRVARRAQSRSAADERVGASMSLCVPWGASAAPARRRAAAVEAYTLPATAVRLCYSGHAAAMGRNIAQRVRADRRCRYSSASFFALHSLLRCAPLLRLTCVPLPLPRWLACLPGAAQRAARTLCTVVCGCVVPACVCGAHRAAFCAPAAAQPTAQRSQRATRASAYGALLVCHNMSRAILYERLRLLPSFALL